MAIAKKGGKRTDGLESIEMVQVVYEAIKAACPVVGDLWLLGVETSARGCDIRDLSWADIDFRSDSLRLKQSKTGNIVEVEITDTARAILERRHAAKGDQEYVFQVDSNRSKGKPVSRSKVTATIKEAVDVLKYQGVIPFDMVIGMHSSRKTIPTLMHRSGVSIEEIAMTLGHKDVQHTIRYLSITQKKVNTLRRNFSTGIEVE